MPGLERKKKISYAIVDKAKDKFVTMENANNLMKLKEKYSPSKYYIYDMTGKDDIPQKENATTDDLTIDTSTKDWKWKFTDEELIARKKVAKLFSLRIKMVETKGDKDTAEGLGPDYANIVIKLNADMTAVQKEIDDLIG